MDSNAKTGRRGFLKGAVAFPALAGLAADAAPNPRAAGRAMREVNARA